jgi:acyl carrier protein
MSAGQRERTLNEIVEIVRGLLAADDDRTFDGDRPVEALGVDSLLAMDLLHALEDKYNLSFPAVTIKNYPTLNLLAEHVSSRLGR